MYCLEHWEGQQRDGLHSDPTPQSENQSETSQNQSENQSETIRNQSETNTNAAAGAAASAAALVFTTAFAVVTTVAAAEAAAPAAAFVLVSDWFLTGFRLVFRLVLTGFRLVFRLGGRITMKSSQVLSYSQGAFQEPKGPFKVVTLRWAGW